MSQEAFSDHFSSVAKRYAGFRPHYPAALFDHLATLVPASAVVWDCAAGNGQATFDLAERFDRVIATDASAQQVASAPVHPQVEFRVATAEKSGLADGSVDLVTVAQALHWFDLERFYAEVRRVLRPGGYLAVWSYGINAVEGEVVNALVYDFYVNTVGPYWPPERKLVEEGYRTIPFPFQEQTSPSIVMEEQWTLEQLLGYFSTWSATTRCIKETGRNPLESLGMKLGQVWDGAAMPRRIVWPLALRIGKV